jgi:hypothetical protein
MATHWKPNIESLAIFFFLSHFWPLKLSKITLFSIFKKNLPRGLKKKKKGLAIMANVNNTL